MEGSMKLISVRDLRLAPGQVWKQLNKSQELVVTSNGRPIAVMTPVCAENLETTLSLLRSARAAAALGTMQRTSIERGNDQLSNEEIEAEIQAARKGRK